MTIVSLNFSVRSFGSAKDPDFTKALQIYDANTHPQTKTDSREIAHWLQHGSKRTNSRFYVCGLYSGEEIVGFTEFIHLKEERLIHFDYFVFRPERKSLAAFHSSMEGMVIFFQEKKIEWDFITAEIAELEVKTDLSRSPKALKRIFGQVGFCEVLADYYQPFLGIEKTDTAIPATLLIRPRVEMTNISRSRLVEIVFAIYFKHYVKWYSIYEETSKRYQASVEKLFCEFKERLNNTDPIELLYHGSDFNEGIVTSSSTFPSALKYLSKLVAGGLLTAAFNFLVKHHANWNIYWILGISIVAFLLIVITITLTDKKGFEAFKLWVSLLGKFLDS